MWAHGRLVIAQSEVYKFLTRREDFANVDEQPHESLYLQLVLTPSPLQKRSNQMQLFIQAYKFHLRFNLLSFANKKVLICLPHG